MATDSLQAPVFADATWQMAWGERSALEGLLTQISPALAIETGTAQGGSLRRIAAHADEVHSFDIDPKVAELGHGLANVVFHIGDSAELLPATLAELHAAGRHVDFALIDGDHSADGVQRDARAVLASEACRRTVVVFHDAANDDVRRGLEALDLPSHPKVAVCLLDFVPGYLCVPDHPQYPLAIWNGLGLVVLGERDGAALTDRDHLDVPELYRRVREGMRGGEARAPARITRLAPVALAAAAGAAAGAAAMRLGYRARR